MTPERERRIQVVLAKRQEGLVVVIDNVFDPHNVAAILRSCEAFGVTQVHLFYSFNRMPTLRDLRSKAAASASKWLTIKKWTSAEALAGQLRQDGFQMALADVAEDSVVPAAFDFTAKTALIFGSESTGASEELKRLADVRVKIPMVGFVESFNVSVAAGILLYEAYRQRAAKGMYG
jgi:tRNA (guanosine-2'-O-)-methyltransferase